MWMLITSQYSTNNVDAKQLPQPLVCTNIKTYQICHSLVVLHSVLYIILQPCHVLPMTQTP